MGLRILKVGCQGEDVRAVQKALNRNGRGLGEDGVFGPATRDAVRQYQTDNSLNIDGEVGPQTRRELFPLVAVTVNVIGTRVGSLNRLGNRNFGIPPLTLDPPTLTLDPPKPRLDLRLPSPVTLGMQTERIPGLLEPIAIPVVPAATVSSSGPDWQQFAQSQRQFTGLFRGPFVDSFGIGIQTVFNRSDDDNHVELTTGCLLQSPIGFQDGQGNNFTLGCFANATWVDPIFHFRRFHLANPYAQVQFQGNASGPVLPTAQIGLFPVNINVDLTDDGLQLNFGGGALWSLTLDGNRLVSTWGTQLGFGLVGKFRLFGN